MIEKIKDVKINYVLVLIIRLNISNRSTYMCNICQK